MHLLWLWEEARVPTETHSDMKRTSELHTSSCKTRTESVVFNTVLSKLI